MRYSGIILYLVVLFVILGMLYRSEDFVNSLYGNCETDTYVSTGFIRP